MKQKTLYSKKAKLLVATSAVAVASVAPTIDKFIPALNNVAHAAGEFAGGTGTQADPYLISTPQQLFKMKDFTSSHFKLTNDIDLSGHDWIPITSFSTTFDGNNFAIKNLRVETSIARTGFFQQLSVNSIVKNLTFIDAFVKNTQSYTGVLAGSSYGQVSNVHVKNGQVVGASYTGGLIGDTNAKNTTYERLSFQGIVSGDDYTGGLLGNFTYGNLLKSYVSGTITSTGKYVGGLIGETGSGVNVADVFTTGTVEGIEEKVGGIVGSIKESKLLSNSISTMSVKGKSMVGGLVGSHRKSEISNSFAFNKNIIGTELDSTGQIYGTNNEINNSTSVGKTANVATQDSLEYFVHPHGITKLVSSDRLTSESTYETFDFLNTWKKDSNGLPVLNFADVNNDMPVLKELPGLEIVDGIASKKINRIEEIALMREFKNFGVFHLSADLDLTGVNWEPIEEFNGIFDGKGHVIKNLYIDNTHSKNVGFFGTVGLNSFIKNINFIDPYVKNSASTYTGVLTGMARNGSVSDIHVFNGQVLGTGSSIGGLIGYSLQTKSHKRLSYQGDVIGSDYTGGLIGQSNTLIIDEAFFSGDVTSSGDTYVGGLIGYAWGSGGSIKNIFTTGTISGTNSVGGLFGSLASQMSFANAYTNMTVNSSQKIAAGITGNFSSSAIKDSFVFSPEIKGINSAYITGSTNQNNISNSYAINLNNPNISTSYITMFIKDTDALSKETFKASNFEFGDTGNAPIWAMDEGNGTLPYLVNLPRVNAYLPGYEPANKAPVAEKIENINISIDEVSKQLDLTPFFNDEDGDTLTFTTTAENENVSVSIEDGILTITPNSVGETNVTVTASDPSGASVTAIFKVTVEAAEEEKPVLIKPLPDFNFGEEAEKEYDLGEYIDDENGIFTYSVTSTDPNVATALISENGILKITKKNAGTTTITVTAENTKSEKVVTSFIVTVPEAENPEEPINNPPTVNQIPDQTTTKGTVKTVDLSTYFSDPDGDSLNFTITSANELVGTASVNDSTLSLTPKALGSTTITVTANDGKEGTVAQTFTFSVINATPVITLTNENAKQTITNENKVLIKGTVADADRDTLTVKATLAGIEKSVQVEGDGNFILEWDGNTLPSGKYTNIPVTVIDTNQSSSSAIYSGSIEKEATKAPVFLISDLTSNSVKLSWKSVSPNAVYTLYRDGEEIFQGTDLSVTDNDLMANAEYSYSVKATLAGEDTPESFVGIVTLANKPAELGVTEQNFDSFVTEWDTNNNPTDTKYRFIVKDGKSVKIDTVINSSNWTRTINPVSFRMAAAAKLNYSVTGLEPGKTYTVETRAINKLGMETESVVKEVALEDFIVDELENLRISESSDEKVVVEWDHEQDGVEFVVEKYRGYVKVSTETVKGNAYTDTDVEVGKTYTYKVIPKSEKYNRKASVQSVSTEIPLPDALRAIQNLKVTKTGEKNNKIQWDSLDGATRYYVEIFEGTMRKIYLSTTDTFIETDKLEAGKTYKVSVYAMDTYGRASEKTVIEHEMEKPQPKNITNVTHSVNGNRLTFNWDDISESVYSYYVQMWQDGKQKGNTYVSPKTPTYTTTLSKDGDYEYRIIAYSKETKGFLDPVIVNVQVTKGMIEVTVQEEE